MTMIDEGRVEEFAGWLQGNLVGATAILMIDVGHRTGLLEALAAGPATSSELASRGGYSERHVREWLGSLATAKVLDYDRDSEQYELPAEHAMLLTGDGAMNMATMTGMVSALGRHVPEVVETVHHGGGIPYSTYRPEFTSCMDELGRRRYDEMLVSTYLPLAGGELMDRLGSGLRVADIGCGTGHTTNLKARAFPQSTFVGYDIATDALDRARAEAGELGLTNVTFEVQDVREMPTDPPFDLITAYDVIHDQVDPVGVLAQVRGALADDGLFYMVDIKAETDVADNMDNPLAPLIYGVSTLHCMQVSLAHGGAGLGTAWGVQLAESMLRDAGFGSVEIVELPADPFNVVYLNRP